MTREEWEAAKAEMEAEFAALRAEMETLIRNAETRMHEKLEAMKEEVADEVDDVKEKRSSCFFYPGKEGTEEEGSKESSEDEGTDGEAPIKQDRAITEAAEAGDLAQTASEPGVSGSSGLNALIDAFDEEEGEEGEEGVEKKDAEESLATSDASEEGEVEQVKEESTGETEAKAEAADESAGSDDTEKDGERKEGADADTSDGSCKDSDGDVTETPGPVAANEEEEEEDDDDDIPGLEEVSHASDSQEEASTEATKAETATAEAAKAPTAKKARPLSMWVAGGQSARILQEGGQQDGMSKADKRKSTLVLSRDRLPSLVPIPPSRKDRGKKLLDMGRTQSIPNFGAQERKEISTNSSLSSLSRVPSEASRSMQVGPVSARGMAPEAEDRAEATSELRNISEAMKVVAAAIFKGLSWIEAAIEEPPPKKLKGFVHGRALVTFLVTLLRLRSRGDAMKLLNAVAPRYLMDATALEDSAPIIMDETREWFGFKIPVFMFPEKVQKLLPSAAKLLLGHTRFGPARVDLLFPAASGETPAGDSSTSDDELMSGVLEISDRKAKKWHRRHAVLHAHALKLYKGSEATELLQEIPLHELRLITFDRTKFTEEENQRVSQFLLTVASAERTTYISIRTPDDAAIGVDDWAVALDAASCRACALLSLMDASAMRNSDKMFVQRMQAHGSGVIMHDEDNWSFTADSGLVECCSASVAFDDVQLEFKNGLLVPKNQQHVSMFGVGAWDGMNAWWFAPCDYTHVNAMTPPGRRGIFFNADPVLRFHFNRSSVVFAPVAPLVVRPGKEMAEMTAQDLTSGSCWTWTGEDLVRQDGGGVAWTVEGDVPMGVVMLLQLLRYYAVKNLHMEGTQLPVQEVPDFNEGGSEPVVTQPSPATPEVRRSSASPSPVPSPTTKKSVKESSDEGTVQDSSKSEEEKVAEEEDVKPLPQETTINLSYNSPSRQDSMSSMRTKVKRSRRRSVKLTGTRRMSEQSSPSSSPRVMPSVDD